MITCSSCGSDNPKGHSFCSNCGTALANACPSCGTANEPGHRFCFNCGTALTVEQPTAPSSAPAEPIPASADSGERRLVSVVFADLVGYTSLSEGRDPEDIRSMLTEYYDRCREIIARYGGVTDKFIGDAVMAVFGAESANEDDAERATRTALELVDMVQGLGGDVGMEGLDARAGVMSGEASVGSGGNEHGLVVGDLVNTASRLQSIAPPGGVFVGEATRDLVGTAIEFADGGEHQVKGKEIRVRAFKAVRVLALSQHSRQRGELGEGPFVGRGDELRMLKDQLHATGREKKARMVSIIGEGGIGKTRLSQELVRYIDGLTEIVYYHNGRSPSYGDGVTFWALGEMIRQRAGISEGEDPVKSRMKLRTMVSEFAPDEDDQRWIEPRLAAIIGLTEMPPGDRSELYAALRTFFQRIAERGTVLMVFEDLHWGDEGLLDFIEELVERTTSSPILVVTLGRPELVDRRKDWGASRRRSLLMHLSRLDDASMGELVTGLVPGIPETTAARIAKRTAGIPLHAVEFVRMLVNTGQLVRNGDIYELVGEIEEMAIPDTVSAIISARLDRLDSAEAALIQDASVLGMSFALDGIAHMRGQSTDQVAPTLRSLVRSDILEFDEDPRSPERGQYRFVQSLIKEVAYGRLTKQDRASRHLAVAKRLEELDDPEWAAVIASHYASAVAANPGDLELLERARTALISSADRARTLHSDIQAAELYGQALELTDEGAMAAELKVKLAECHADSGRSDLTFEVASEALEFYEGVGDGAGVARAATCIAHALAGDFEATKATEIILPIYESTPQTDDEVWASLATQTSRALALSGEGDRAIEVADESLPVLERLGMIEELLETLINKGTSLGNTDRFTEGVALLTGAASLADQHGLVLSEVRALNNLGAITQNDMTRTDNWDVFDRLIERMGNLGWAIRRLFFASYDRQGRGRLDEALEMVAEGEEMELSEFWADGFALARLEHEQIRDGFDPAKTQEMIDRNQPFLEAEDPQLRESALGTLSLVRFFANDFAGVVDLALSRKLTVWSYPSWLWHAFTATAFARDREKTTNLLANITKADIRGRAMTALARLGEMVEAALSGDIARALESFERMDELNEAVSDELTVAWGRALAASTLPSDHPVAVGAAKDSEAWFSEHHCQFFLDLFAETFARYQTAGDEVAV